MKNIKYILISLTLFLATQNIFAHCQVPCGIYGDDAQFSLLHEDVATITKAMKQINELSAQGENYNQIVRWVNTKEEHADKVQDVIQAYFLSQRVKPVEKSSANYPQYVEKVTLLHQIIVAAMKCKQTTSIQNAIKLGDLITDFQELYQAK